MSRTPRDRDRRRSIRRRLARAAMAAAALGFSLAPQFGCGREFFRHWADQDASEAIFEKSRDPRWRLERFTMEPPALARFANPYDADRQPAPPDDPASAALSPAPQFPYHQLLVPAEGTGYRDFMERGARYEAPPPDPKKPAEDDTPRMDGRQAVPTPPPAPEPGAPSPFNPDGILGPDGMPTTPNLLPSLPADRPGTPPPATGPGSGPNPPQARARTRPKDPGVLATAFQTPGSTPPMPGDAAATVASARPLQDPARPGDNPQPEQERLKPPTPALDPGGEDAVNPNTRPVPRADRTPEQSRADRAASAGFQAQLSPGIVNFNEANAAGFPADSRPYVVNPSEALQLALMNSRAYQFRLENVYVTALNVTLQRFLFQPTFFAGASPTTSSQFVGIPSNPVNQFTYRTKEFQGGQNSALNLGTAAGVTKYLSFGGRFAASFANQTVFNFLGNNPSQPTVTSFLPITFSQQFLRGGGRAVTLEGLTQQERNLLYEVRTFTRFRQSVVPAYLMANQQLIGTSPEGDPNPGYLQVIQNLQRVENDRVTVAAYEQVLKLFKEYVQGGASSGISQIQVDQIASQLASQRSTLLSDEANYKTSLDNYKISLGLPPDLPMILDRTPLQPFRDVFNSLYRWSALEDHDPDQLDGILSGLPKLESILVDDRPLFRYNGVQLTQVYADPEKQQEFLLAAERVALENRVDLMNNRATLYDTWRQLAVTANGLQGVFNVNVSNQIGTPVNNQNPLGFLDQSKQFSVQFQTELPLIRVTERNAYRNATINYNRAQRLLQSQEDDIKQTVRQQIYQLIQIAEQYEIAKVNLLLNIRQRDLSQQTLIAPPVSIDANANAAQQATQTLNLITGINAILNQQNLLIQSWVQFESLRLALFRDLGLMPYDEWEAFYEFFPTNSGTGAKPAAGGVQPSAARPAGAPAPEGRP